MRKTRINKTAISVVTIICVTLLLCSIIFISANVDLLGAIKSKYGDITGNYAGLYVSGPMSIAGVGENEERRDWMDIAEDALHMVVYIENYGDTQSSAGSGIIMTVDGYIVTNYHVIEGAREIYVELYNDTRYKATVIGGDKYTDIAVIKINATGLTPATFGDSDALRSAEPVLAVGNPGGSDFKFSVTSGIVSSMNRPMDLGYGYTVNCIQTDAAINPGNSGGALFNQYGQVIGINSAKIVAEGYEGLGFAITTRQALPIVNTLCESGSIERALLGVSGTLVTVSKEKGIMINSITNSSITENGIAIKDIVLKIDGTSITSTSSINAIVQYKKPGDEVSIEYYRYKDGKTYTTKVKLASSK